MLFKKIKLLFTHGKELEQLLLKMEEQRKEDEFRKRQDFLNLCERHQQESIGSHYSQKNCHYCQLLDEKESLAVELGEFKHGLIRGKR